MDVWRFEMELIMLVGIPTSGKSTFSNNPKYKNYVRVSSDDILQEIAKEKKASYNAIFESNIRFAQIAMMKVLRNAIEDGKSIIWDQTNLTKKQRREKIKQIPAHYKKTAVYFIIDLKTALERNTTRPGKVIPPEVLERMIKQYELPTLEEGFDQIIKGN
jgi:predicted kinase